jgi:hypothetical protein
LRAPRECLEHEFFVTTRGFEGPGNHSHRMAIDPSNGAQTPLRSAQWLIPAPLASLLFDGSGHRANVVKMDRTPQYLKLTYEKWFNDHPGARAEMSTTTVRQRTQPGASVAYIKNSLGGEVEITKEEFDARYWAREWAPR